MDSKSPKSFRHYSGREEIANSITHGIGALLSIVAFVVLIMVAGTQNDILRLVSFSIYGITLILLYLSSTLYHSFKKPKLKDMFAKFDHVSIFLLIAGTYTPILLTNIRGVLGWIIFGIVWTIAIAGGIVRIVHPYRYRKLMVAIYLLMGWLFILLAKTIVVSMPSISVNYLVLGGIAYSVGVIFYLWRKLPYGHGIWHLFVLTGSILHFFAIYYSVK